MLRQWQKLFRDGGIDALAEAAKDPQFAKLPSVSANMPGKDVAKSLVDPIRDEIKKGKWRNILRFSSQQWRDGLAMVQPHADIFLGLVEQFGAAYQQAKRAIGSLDFADLERFTLGVLSEGDGGVASGPRPPPARFTGASRMCWSMNFRTSTRFRMRSCRW